LIDGGFLPASCDSQIYSEIQKTLRDQSLHWIPVASATPRYLYKVRRLTVGKRIQNQLLTKSVLNPQSREVQRQTGREREFGISAGAPQCGGLRARPAVIGVFCALESPQRMLVAERLAEREEPGSNGLLIWSAQSSTWKSDWDTTDQLKRQRNFLQVRLASGRMSKPAIRHRQLTLPGAN
jgi:hypothetical protein